jgi:hypothetical protein
MTDPGEPATEESLRQAARQRARLRPLLDNLWEDRP